MPRGDLARGDPRSFQFGKCDAVREQDEDPSQLGPVEARCVRLNAKAETPAAVAPAVERRSAVARRQPGADRDQGRSRQSLRHQGGDGIDALRGISAYLGPRLCRCRDRRADRHDRPRSVRLVRRPRHPPRRHPCHASCRRGRCGCGEAEEPVVGGSRRDRRALRHGDRRLSPRGIAGKARDGGDLRRDRQGRPGRGANRELARRARDWRGAQARGLCGAIPMGPSR